MYFILFIFVFFFISYMESTGFSSFLLTKESGLRNKELILFWFCSIFAIVVGLQFDVGTDYFSYVNIFTSERETSLYYRKKEYLFYFLSEFLLKNNVHPQWGFIVLSLIQFVFIYKFLKFMNLGSYTIFLYLYFTVCTFLYNQTNGIRQYTAATILLMSIRFFYSAKYIRAFFFIYIASLFHNSAILFVAVEGFMFLLKKKWHPKLWGIGLVLAVLMIRINIIAWIVNLVPYLSRYSHYLTNAYGMEEIEGVNILTKVVYLPFYLLSLLSLRRMQSNKDIFFFQLGIFSYCVKLSCLSSPIMNRFAAYFEIFTILPLYYFFLDFFSRKIRIRYFDRIFFFLFLAISLGLFFIKTTVMATAEYDYESILVAIFRGNFNLE